MTCPFCRGRKKKYVCPRCRVQELAKGETAVGEDFSRVVVVRGPLGPKGHADPPFLRIRIPADMVEESERRHEQRTASKECVRCNGTGKVPCVCQE